MRAQQVERIVEALASAGVLSCPKVASDVLSKRFEDSIFLEWGTDDVLVDPFTGGPRTDLSREEAREILHDVNDNWEANTGVNWDLIEEYVRGYIRERDESEGPGGN